MALQVYNCSVGQHQVGRRGISGCHPDNGGSVKSVGVVVGLNERATWSWLWGKMN